MSESEEVPAVFVQGTDNGDGSADFTITFADEDHKFSARARQGGVAIVEYEETLSWRGQPRVKEPGEDIFRELVQSDEVTQFLEAHDCASVRREKRNG